MAHLPALLRGQDPSPGAETVIGTRDYSKPARVIITGGAYDGDKISMMRNACKGSQVPWLRNDKSKPAPPVGPMYAAALVERVKTLLADLTKDGKMESDGVYWY